MMLASLNRHCFTVIILIPFLVLGSISLFNPALSFTITGQNEARYARGQLPNGDDYNYFENYLEINANLDKLRFYIRQSYLLPSEFDGRWQTDLNVFNKRYIEYSQDEFLIRGGDFYRNWGRGLLFGTVEYTDLNFDTGLQGVLIESSIENFEGALFRGVETDTANIYRR